jgi:hypothetical protein
MEEYSAYVINLESRKDRRAEMERQLRRVGWNAEFFPAIRPADPGDFESIGARGCFLSHLEVLRQSTKFDRHLLLMEDDLNFVPDFRRLWDPAYAAIQDKAWSIFYPGHVLTSAPPGLHKVKPSKNIACAHFVMFHKAAVRKLVDALEIMLSRPGGHPMGGPMIIDAAYNVIRQQNPELATYVWCPSLGYQRASRSDIWAPLWYDRIQPLRPAVDFLRKFKKIGNHVQSDDSLN